MTIKRLVTGFLFSFFAVKGQVHLITASPTPMSTDRFPAAVYSVSETGGVALTSEIVPAKLGTDWVGYSYDLKKAVFVTGYPLRRIFVLDMRSGSVEKQCVDPPPKGDETPTEQWLLDVPGTGPTIAELLSGSEPRLGYVRGMSLSAADSCEKSFFAVNLNDLKNLETDGHAGVDMLAPPTGMGPIGVDPDGKIKKWLPGGVTYFDCQIPKEMLAGIDRPTAAIMIDNKAILVLDLGAYGKPSSFRLLVFRKADRSWHRVPDVSEIVSWVRGFDGYIAIAEARSKLGSESESSGRERWRVQATKTGPSMKDLFELSKYVYPGKLHLYDSSNGQLYTIDTKQGDSEVLLVQEGVVYYRVSDQLYSAQITGTGLTPGRLLATSDIIRDAHWAFLTH